MHPRALKDCDNWENYNNTKTIDWQPVLLPPHILHFDCDNVNLSNLIGGYTFLSVGTNRFAELKKKELFKKKISKIHCNRPDLLGIFQICGEEEKSNKTLPTCALWFCSLSSLSISWPEPSFFFKFISTYLYLYFLFILRRRVWLDSILHYAFFFEILFLLVQFFFFTQTFFVHEWGEDIIWTFWTNRAGHERAQREKEIDEELKHVENFLFFGSVLYIRMRRRRRKIIGVRVWRQFISWNYTHTHRRKKR